MYCDHFGFRCSPFDDRADTQFTYVTPALEEVLAGLEYEARFGRGVALVLGDAGVGKTQALRSLLLRLHSTDHAVVVTVPTGCEFDPIRETCKGFGVSLPSSGGHAGRRLSRLRRHLSRNAQAGHRSILLLDQGENVTSAGLSQIATLTELQDERGRLLCVLLFGQTRLRRLLEEPEFARLRQQFMGERVLPAMNEAETGDYLRHRLRVAGAGDVRLIDPSAVPLIFAASNGVPRLVNHVTNEALVTAYAAGATRVTAAIVEEAIGTTELKARGARLVQPGSGVTPPPSVDRNSLAVPLAGSPREPMSARPTKDWSEDSMTGEAFGQPTAYESAGVVVSAGAPEALANSLSTLFAQGNDLLERLERVLAKTERTCAVSDASLAQHTAVERHLTTLSTGAERILHSLDQAVEHAQRTLQEAPRRVEESLVSAEGRIAQIDGRLAALSQVEDRIGQRSARIESFQRQASEAEERLQAVIGDLEAKFELASRRSEPLNQAMAALSRIQPDAERTIGRIREQMKESEARATAIEERERRSAERARQLRSELESLDAKATTVIEVAGRELDGLVRGARDRVQAQLGELRRTEESVGQAEATVRLIVESAVSQFQKQLDGMHQAAVESVKGSMETLSRKREDVAGVLLEIEAGIQRLRTEGTAAVAGAEAATAPIVERTTKLCREQLQEQASTLRRLHEEKLAAALAEHRERITDLTATTERSVQEVHAAIESAERRQNRLEQAAAALSEKLSDAAIVVSGLGEQTGALVERAGQLHHSVETMQTETRTTAAEIETLSTRASTIRADLATTVERASGMTADVFAAGETAGRISRTVSAALEGITQAEERVEAMRERTGSCEELAKRLEREAAVGQACVTDLRSATQSAAETRQALMALSQEASERVGQLDSHLASASRVRNELAESNVVANLSLQRAESERGSLETLVKGAGDAVGRLVAVQASANESAARLDELVEIAESAYRRADEVVAEVDARGRELANGMAEATNAARRLTECGRSASQLVERVEQSARRAEQTSAGTEERVDRLLKEVWSLTGKSETTAKELATANTRAAELVGKLANVAAPAHAATSELLGALADAEARYEQIARDAQEAKKLAERVASVTQVLAGAREAEESIRQTATDVLSLQDRFAALVTQAAQHSVSLRELLSSVQTMTAEQSKARADADAILRRLDDHRSATEAATQAGEELLRGFIARSEDLERQIQEVGGKIAAVENDVRNALSHRDATVEQAKAQSAQLERVGDAVRKVFAAVSQATLDARERAKELTGVNRESAEKLAVFTAETERATETLQEWVREAVRAQERLERTLRIVPAIQQTHPRESMTGSSRGPIPTSSGAEPRPLQDLRPLSATEPKEMPAHQAPASRVPHRVGRAGEIARLIEDAKNAAVTAK